MQTVESSQSFRQEKISTSSMSVCGRGISVVHFLGQVSDILRLNENRISQKLIPHVMTTKSRLIGKLALRFVVRAHAGVQLLPSFCEIFKVCLIQL